VNGVFRGSLLLGNEIFQVLCGLGSIRWCTDPATDVVGAEGTVSADLTVVVGTV